MYTSANALHRVLVAVAQTKNQKERFRSVLAQHLGLEGEDGEMQAVVYLHKLTRQVRDDIKASGISNEYQSKLRGHLSAFKGILSLAQLTQTIEDSKKSILMPDALNNLTVIDMALDGKINRYDDGLHAKELVSSIDEIKEEISDSSLPDELKKALYGRLNQVRSAVDHIRFYGIEGLEEALSMLAAEAFFTNTTKSQVSENPGVFKKIFETVQTGMRWVNLAKNTMKGTREAIDEAPKMFEALENLTKM